MDVVRTCLAVRERILLDSTLWNHQLPQILAQRPADKHYRGLQS